MSHECGYDGGDDNAPICGKPSEYHVFAGSPATGPGNYSMHSCATHLFAALTVAFDWHPTALVCGVPGTIWQSKGQQGDGFCYWPEAEKAYAEALEPKKVEL
ncbi:hypothetical protein CQ015_03565 [Arthrobacter sp. MYb221]|nr:hypothetical protein CQ015_03565 [Arthrobacter sp. MYb221]